MSDEIGVDPDELRRDADAKWIPWRDRLHGIRSRLPEQTSAAAFSTIPGSTEVHTRFDEVLTALREYLADGSDAFDELAGAVLSAAGDRRAVDEEIAQDLTNITKGLEGA